MKIVSISFSNINNLKGGPHVISFENSPLDTAGIFAIIGPTGSGKSTILDVITLALFNQIPRFNNKITKKEISDNGSVMTLFASSADASIVYEIKGLRWTSNWSVSKARTGALKDYEMTLQNAAGEYLDLKKSEVPSKNEDIIGLKYDQFVKAIILSQGEFAKFLKADKNERGRLLENITGTSIYRKLGAAAYSKYKGISERVSLEIEKLGVIQVLTEEEKADIYKEISLAEEEKTKSDKTIEKLKVNKQIKQEIDKIKSSLTNRKIEVENSKQKIIGFKPLLEKLNRHQLLSPLRGDFSLYKSNKESAQLTEQNLTGYRESLEQAEAGISATLQKAQKLTNQKVDLINFKLVINAFEREVTKMDLELANIQTKGEAQRTRIGAKQDLSTLGFNKNTKAQDALKKLQEQKEEFLVVIRKSQLGEKADVAVLKSQLKADQETLGILKEINNLLKQSKDIENAVVKEKEKSDLFQATIMDKTPLLQKCKTAVEALRKNEKNLQKRKEDAIKIASLEELRPSLVQGDPCPLCGSLDHPFSEHLPPNEKSNIEKELQETLKLISTEEQDLKRIADIITEAETTVKISIANLVNLEKKRTEIAKIQDNLFDSLPSYKDLDLSKMDELLSSLSKNNEQLSSGIEALEILKVNTDLIVEYNDLLNIGKEYKRQSELRSQKYNGNNISLECNQLQDELNTYITSKTKDSKALEIETKEFVRATDILIKTENKITPKLEKFGFSSIDELADQILSESEYEDLKTKSENLLIEKTKLDTEIETLQKDQSVLLDKDDLQSIEYEDLVDSILVAENQRDYLSKSIGEFTSKLKHDDDLKLKRAGREKDIEALSLELGKWSQINSLIGDATGSKFANFAQGLTLKNLLVFTNKRLAKLSDRYLLGKPKDDVLQVIDQYQGNIERAVSTLSGGETFLISLALALSLSDLASRNVPLDSLFIDEGFGTLDQDSLEIALNTLERLQTESQKTVGVISHVDALKERIHVQIILEKNAQGYSSFKIVS